MTVDERFALVRSIGEECIQEEELRVLLDKKPEIFAYDGFEPSGRMHIAQGVLKSINVNKLTSAGVTFKFWIADWFAQLNNKMGGDLKKIKLVGEYMIEVWKAVGMDLSKVQFLWASEEINARSEEYWTLVMDIAIKNNLKRIIRCSQIMGRNDTDDLSAAQIFYPCMQAADIFFLKADICQLGLDQRKVNMLAREYCDDCKPKRKFKPVILSHRMMPGLKQGQEKMSKSDPESAIFMEDSEQEVKTKIKKAFCEPMVIENNPCIEYTEHIVLPYLGEFTVSKKDAEPTTYTDAAKLKEDYTSGALHPSDLKPALAEAINKILQPVRAHFENDPHAKELLKKVKALKVTR